MKWSSLGYREQNNLKKLYDKRHEDEMPVKPDEFEAPQLSARTVVALGGQQDVYVRISTNDNRSHPTCEGRIRLVGGAEHIDVMLPAEAIDKLILQLSTLKDDIEAYEAEARAHVQHQKEYGEAKQAYEQKREADLIRALKDNKFTEEQIKSETGKIPF